MYPGLFRRPAKKQYQN